ncbi:hypothetical protein IJT10_08160, partial [bacterium]|nr:hypothetical protein [bacterium]
MELKTLKSNNQEEKTQQKNGVVINREGYVPSRVMLTDIDLSKENIARLFNTLGYDLPDVYAEEFYRSLVSKNVPLSIPAGDRSYSYILITEEKNYLVRPLDAERRIEVEEEIVVSSVNVDFPPVILHADMRFGKFDVEVILDREDLDDETCWSFADTLSRMRVGKPASGVSAHKISEDSDELTYLGDDISLTFSPSLSKEEATCAMPRVKREYDELLVPYSIQISTTDKELEKKVMAQFESEKIQDLFDANAFEALKVALAQPEETPFVVLDMIHNESKNLRFMFSNDCTIASEDMYDPDADCADELEEDDVEEYNEEDLDEETDEEDDGVVIGESDDEFVEDDEDNVNYAEDDRDTQDMYFQVEVNDSPIGRMYVNVAEKMYYEPTTKY